MRFLNSNQELCYRASSRPRKVFMKNFFLVAFVTLVQSYSFAIVYNFEVEMTEGANHYIKTLDTPIPKGQVLWVFVKMINRTNKQYFKGGGLNVNVSAVDEDGLSLGGTPTTMMSCVSKLKGGLPLSQPVRTNDYCQIRAAVPQFFLDDTASGLNTLHLKAFLEEVPHRQTTNGIHLEVKYRQLK